MPRIAEIEFTPNPNARKFILREPLTFGVSKSFETAEQAKGDTLAEALFAIPHVTNVFYVDYWLTVTQDGKRIGPSCCASSRCRFAMRPPRSRPRRS